MNKHIKNIGFVVGGLLVTTIILGIIKPKYLSNKPKVKKKDDSEKTETDKPVIIPAISKSDIGKKIYTKRPNVNLRTSARINNGWINNIQKTVESTNTYLGIIKDIKIPDEKFFNPATDKPYVWILFDFVGSPQKELYAREDTIKTA